MLLSTLQSLHDLDPLSDPLAIIPHRVQLHMVDDPDTSFEAMTEREYEQLECGMLDPEDDLEWDPQGDEGSPMLVSLQTTALLNIAFLF